jgi:ribosomal protein S18 acetylase RimI-like enzyme
VKLAVSPIDHTARMLRAVIDLGDANRKTLGLLPRAAYRQSAERGWIITATDQTSHRLAGYLLYRVARRKMLVYIVHLCVATHYRRRGVAAALFRELCAITRETCIGVRVHCRIDYEANALWPNLGFQAVREVPGRSKSRASNLRIWLYDYGHPSLFALSARQELASTTRVAIDANVFFQLEDPSRVGHEESAALLEPWVDIDLCLAPETFNEIARNPDSAAIERARNFANGFTRLEPPSDDIGHIVKALAPLLPSPKKPSDKSDRRQLAGAIAAGVPFFVTRDEGLLATREQIGPSFGIEILRPADIILLQDELRAAPKYSPAPLSGSAVKIERVHSQEFASLVSDFQMSESETKAKFSRKVQTILAQPHSYETIVVRNASDVLALVAYGRVHPNEVTIPIFRLRRSSLTPIIGRHLLADLPLRGATSGPLIVRLEDSLSPLVASIVQESGFEQAEGCWFKISIVGVFNRDQLRGLLGTFPGPAYARNRAGQLAALLDDRTISDAQVLVQVEKALWPVKISDVGVAAFIVPIRPRWAMHLFDVDTASQDLFGGEPALLLSAENVYYRANFGTKLTPPARILWYVSGGHGRYQGSMAIKACSYLDQVEVGEAKRLFSKYRKLGIFEWKDLYDGPAHGDAHRRVMVLRFSASEVLQAPIPLARLQKLWSREGAAFNPVAPLSIKSNTFISLYKEGMGKA